VPLMTIRRATVASHGIKLPDPRSSDNRVAFRQARTKVSWTTSSDPWSRKFPVILEDGPHDHQSYRNPLRRNASRMVDRTRCTATPANEANGSRPAGEAYLTEAVAPWPCSTYLHIRAGEDEISMPVEYAAPVLSAPMTLTAAAEAARW